MQCPKQLDVEREARERLEAELFERQATAAAAAAEERAGWLSQPQTSCGP